MVVSVFQRKDRGTWRCQWQELGKRRVKDFPTRSAANAFAVAKRREMKEYGQATITEEERAVLILARAKGLSVARLREWVNNASEQSEKAVSLLDSLEHWLRTGERRNLRERTLRGHRDAVAGYLRWTKSKTLADVMASDVVTYLHARYASDQTRRTRKGSIAAWLRWCASQGWIQAEVAEGITWTSTKTDERRVGILTPEQTAALMQEAPRQYWSAWALLLFAGVRPAEVQRMEWSAVDFEGWTITIEGAVSKTRSFRRLHDLPDNLWAWLEAEPKKNGAIAPANARNAAQALRNARQRAGIVEWPHDAMRHSFGSYGYHRGLEWVVDTMGHVAGFRTFVRHYKGAASKGAADQYFAILPPKCE